MDISHFSKNKTISYAQNGEDVLLYRLFKNQSVGFYIDVGAAHPVFDNVSYLFYEKGWKGISVEPIKKHFELLQKQRDRDVNLNMCLSDKRGKNTFYYFPEIDGWSTLDKKKASQAIKNGQKCEEISIPIETLANICQKYAKKEIDFLKVDVEGFELSVLKGGDWKKFRPRVVVFEDSDQSPKIQTFLEKQNYQFAIYDGLNRFFVRDESAEDLLPLLNVGPNIGDDYMPYKYLQPMQQLAYELDLSQQKLAKSKK